MNAFDHQLSLPEIPRYGRFFFGRRKSRPLTIKQKELFRDLFPKFSLDLSTAAPKNLSLLFESPVSGIHLEIGYGGGEHLVHQLIQHPNLGIIGAEPFVAGIYKLLSQLKIIPDLFSRVRLYGGDATHLLKWLPPNSLCGIDLLYPDPWPKRRHWKRRFICPNTLDRFSKVLIKGSLFRFASDVDCYVNWTLQHFQYHTSFEWTAKSSSDWKKPYPGWLRTRYEEKSLCQGRCPTYLSFKRI